MAWTSPFTWTVGLILTAAKLNEQIRDNLLALSGHAHTGAAGDGAASVGPLVKADLTDASAPAAPAAGQTRIYSISGRVGARANGGTAKVLVDQDSAESMSNKTLTTPTIASFVNAAHDHSDAAGGGLVAGHSVYDRVTSDTDVVSTNAETTVYTKTITGGDLSTNRRLRLTIEGDYLNNTGSASQPTLRVKFGATTLIAVATATLVTADADRRAWKFVVELSNRGATNSQYCTAEGSMSLAPTPTSGVGSMESTAILLAMLAGTAAEDSTADKALVVTWQHDASSASLSFRLRAALLELI